MLVANPGHTPYSFASNKITNNSTKNKTSSSTTTITTTTSSSSLISKPSTSSNDISTTNYQKSSSLSTSFATASTSKASTVSTNLGIVKTTTKYNDVFNTISVRINRGTELIKQTVNKALFSKIPQSLGGLLTVPPTSVHRSPDRNTKSTDSLKLEMCHFKPIKTVPTTPSKTRFKVILKTPKAKRPQKGSLLRFTPIKSTISLLNLSSQSSAFYLVKRSNEIKYTTTTATIEDINKRSETRTTRYNQLNNEINKTNLCKDNSNESSSSTATINKTNVRLKRIRDESITSIKGLSAATDAKKICLMEDNNKNSKSDKLTSSSSRKYNNHLIKPNGLIIENGKRRSSRISNRKIANLELNEVINTKSNTNKKPTKTKSITNNNKNTTSLTTITKTASNVDNKNEKVLLTKSEKNNDGNGRRFTRNSNSNNSSKQIVNDNNNDTNINDSNIKSKKKINNKNDKSKNKDNAKNNVPKNKSKILPQKQQQQQQNKEQTNKRQRQYNQKQTITSGKRKLNQEKNVSVNIDCVHNLRPRIQRNKVCYF